MKVGIGMVRLIRPFQKIPMEKLLQFLSKWTVLPGETVKNLIFPGDRYILSDV